MPNFAKSRQCRLSVRARTASSSSPFPRPAESQSGKFNDLLADIFRMTVDTGPRGVLRLAQAVEAVVSIGAQWFVEQAQGGSTLSSSPPRLLRRLFERLGATYIKLGQFIASSPSLFPDEYVNEFQSCLDRTPAIPFADVKAIIQEDLGRSLDDVYEYVDSAPLASASIAQVHAARLKGSKKDVVIKVLKPGVVDVLRADLNFLYVAARVLEFLNPQISRTSLVSVIGDLRTSIMEEADFQKEAVNVESFRTYLETMNLFKQATAPVVYRHCSTRRVLTMERLYGVPLTDLKSISSIVPNPEATLITALNVWFGSLLGCETFHADVHAGNLLVLRDGRIGFIDFGIVGRVSPKTWVAVETFLASFGTGDYYAMATALNQMGATDKKVDLLRFSKDLEKIFSAVKDLDSDIRITTAGGPQGATVAATLAVDERQINALLLDVFRLSEAYGLRFPREFGLLLKQLLYFDRYTRLLAPDLKVLQDERVIIGKTDRRYSY
ncbi:hypothetical protein SELMODRAFT_165641 [Selaginella moellendorffii]|uniref:Protein kinase domain-containing protein n=2 Tax=Selaginella moellendorffii TaxID=88036 RepID=D8QVR4_SELML|nr:hypothetical protein SELMODRAFT_165641 [Selaginella moellendorffii]